MAAMAKFTTNLDANLLKINVGPFNKHDDESAHKSKPHLGPNTLQHLNTNTNTTNFPNTNTFANTLIRTVFKYKYKYFSQYLNTFKYFNFSNLVSR